MKYSHVLFLSVVTFVAADINIVPISGGLSGSGTTTRYWDCCKPACSWVENLNGTGATTACRSCSADGVTTVGANEMSGCAEHGTAFMCTNQQPSIYNETLAIGFVGASFTGGADVSRCCSCILLSFKDQIVGKHMVVQITNTGSDANKNHFDIEIPGGGVGIFNGCSTQWNASVDGWGDRYGGVHSVEECDNLPKQLQPGCKWRFTWFGGADNPAVDFYEIECPRQLLEISGCQ